MKRKSSTTAPVSRFARQRVTCIQIMLIAESRKLQVMVWRSGNGITTQQYRRVTAASLRRIVTLEALP